MRNIDKDVLIEIEVLKNLQQAESLIHGWDHSWEDQTDSRSVTGMVFSRRDIDHFLSIVRRRVAGEAEKGICLGLTEVSSSDWRIFVIRYIVATDTLSIDEFSLDPGDGSTSHIANIASWTYTTPALVEGLQVELNGKHMRVYDLDFNLIESYVFEVDWEENIGGIYGVSFDVDSFFMYQLMRYGYPSAKYSDYSLIWQINEGWDGSIEISQEDRVYWKSGSLVNIYLKEFRRPGIGDDYHNDLSLAFSGFIADVEPQGFDSTNFSLSLCGLDKMMDREKELTPLDDIDYMDLSYQERNGEDILSDIYGDSFDADVIDFTGDPMEDRVIMLDGSLRDVERFIMYEEGQHSIITPIGGGRRVNIHIHDDLSGESRSVTVGGDEQEDILLKFDMEEKIGTGEFINQLKTDSVLGVGGYRWLCRANRYDRFVDQEILPDLEQNERVMSGMPSYSSLRDYTEGKIEVMKLYWSGDITLAGNHHYLAGLHPQGKIILTYADKGIIAEEFSIERMTISPTQTRFRITKSPRMERITRIEQLRRDLQPIDTGDIIRSLRYQKGELWEDSKTDLWDDVSDILDVDIRNEVGGSILKNVEWESNMFRGYRYLDLKIKSPDLNRGSHTLVDWIRKDFSQGYEDGDEPREFRIFGGIFEVQSGEVSPLGGTKSLLVKTDDYGGVDESIPYAEYRMQYDAQSVAGNLIYFDYWRENNDAVAGAGGDHKYEWRHKDQVILSVVFSSDTANALRVYANGEYIGLHPLGCEEWFRAEFSNIDWDNLEADFTLRDMDDNVIFNETDLAFVNPTDKMDRFVIIHDATSIDSYFDSLDMVLEYTFTQMGLPTSPGNMHKIWIKTVDSDPLYVDIDFPDLLKYGMWILPSFFRILFTDLRENSITVGGDIYDFLDRVDDLSIFGTGGADGTYSVDRSEYSAPFTRIFLNEEIDHVLTGGYISTGIQTELDITVGIKMDAGLVRAWDRSILL